MAIMLNVYDRSTRKKTAVLQNAFDIVETHELNQIYSLTFSLPSIDEKNKYCLPRHFVRWGDNGELYRIKSPKVSEGNTGIITYECEHVITTLCDIVMFGSYQYGGASIKTSAVITWLLSQQKEQNWVLGECDFDRKFEYLWEQESILNALYSIPKEFTSPYKWVFDTTVYPWRISLKVIDPTVKPEFYLRARSNILASGTSADYSNICTRIYPLGYGEGVNQLNIKSVNNDVPYLQSPDNIIAQYGIVEKVLVDRRFENAESLKAYAQTMLDLYQTPSMSRSFDVTDLYPLTNYDWDQAEVGKICRMTQDDTIAYITKTQWTRDKAGDLRIDLSTKATDIASVIADTADRVRIESVYAQGATQLYQHSKDANATTTKGMIMSLYFPSEMRQINKVLMRLKLGRFRSYSQATDFDGGSSQTSEAGGGTTATSESGGGVTSTSEAGGATGNTSTSGGGTINVSLTGTALETTDPNWIRPSPYTDQAEPSAHCNHAGDHEHDLGNPSGSTDQVAIPLDNTGTYWHRHNIESFSGYAKSGGRHNHDVYVDSHNHTIPRSSLKHTHSVSVQVTSNVAGQVGFAHSHTFSIGNHTHKFTMPSHSHNFVMPMHSHGFVIPSHSHNITAGIFESGNPSSFQIKVGNTIRATVNATSYDGDITAWLLNNKNQIPRDSWIDIEIIPNDLAYVQCSVFVQGFVQSRGGGNF